MSSSNPSTDHPTSSDGTTSSTASSTHYHVMSEDVRNRLFKQSSPETSTVNHVDAFIFHYMYERGFSKSLEGFEIALNLFNKKRLIKLIQAGEFERAIAYLSNCKNFLREAEYNTVMRRIFYAYFPCLMLKGETARAMKLITEMENMGLYDQEAKLKYGDLLKFEKLSSVISREMVIGKCAEVVTKDLESIEDHFCRDKPDIPTKFEKLDHAALLNSLQYVFDYHPTKLINTSKNMTVEATTTSIWSEYSGPRSKKKKFSHVSSSERSEASPQIDMTSSKDASSASLTQKQPERIFSISKLNELKVFDSPIYEISIHSGSTNVPPKALVTSIIGGEKDKQLLFKAFHISNFQEMKNCVPPEKLAEFVHMGESEISPAITFAVNPIFIEIANKNKLLLLKLESDKHYPYSFDVTITSILMQGDTACPLLGTATGDLGLADIKAKSITKLGNIDNSPVVMILKAAFDDPVRYILMRNGKVFRVEWKEGKIDSNSIFKYEPDIPQSASLPYMTVHPKRPTEILIKYGTVVHVVALSGKSFSRRSSKEWKDLSAVCYSPDGKYIFVAHTNGEISVWGGVAFLPRGTLLNLDPNNYATYMTLAYNNILLIGTKDGSFISYDVTNTKQ
ncbi:hypothetical protein FDP41_012707 [Naegleria fowleri]|uniref:LisH domain-containing protein n=1 Tax=Naegleria fowleri TaxID=5763 RepID=A0A6A5C6J6_NAEFO|nr:uncharacterized protein FDP41_012707 [Naegleria fowleri]KAF0980919.1 hypothetical protein FDP41_012707 [Naegleria fowleri]